jgi:Mechanosensitive ion channel
MRGCLLQAKPAIEDFKHQTGKRASYRASVLSTSALVLLASLIGHRYVAFSQQLPEPKLDAQARSSDILAHLNSVIQFYRGCTPPIQQAGEPNDVVYRDQAAALSSQATEFAFQWAKAEAVLMATHRTNEGTSSNSSHMDEQQKAQVAEDNVKKQIDDLHAREVALDKQLAAAEPQNIAALQAQQKQVQSALDLANATKDALQKIVEISDSQGGTGFSTDIDRLRLSVPGLQSKNKTAAPVLVTLESAQSSGVTSQGMVLFELLETSVDQEYKSIFHSLLLRVLVIGIALVLIFAGGEVWTRATHKYVRDIRRRRQFLIIRRTAVGLLSAVMILFGFVTQFNSLATFAGFITAGIAVGLQTILLSVAAYFFIIGRYGVKVGDRITIASVTGDVIDVGLVRFYMMGLAGSGTELKATGRVAVFSNAVLFQAGTPLYKQIPGTEYAWRELVVNITETANHKIAYEAILKEIHAVYEGYRTNIEQQHQDVQNWMQTAIDPPAIESHLQFNQSGLQLWARFPVQIKQASETDEKLTQALLELMENHAEVKSAMASTPLIQASVRG